MKVRVSRNILSEADICNFFNATEKFGKRFYRIRYNKNVSENEEYRDIAIDAVAVSRDLIYLIYWTIGCELDEDSPFPRHYKPKKAWHLGWFFPLYKAQDADPCISDAFDYRGFIPTDVIEEV